MAPCFYNLVHDGQLTGNRPLSRLNHQHIQAVRQIRRVESQRIATAFLLANHLPKQIAHRHLDEAFCFHIQALVGGIREDVQRQAFQFLHIRRRIIGVQIELVGIVFNRGRRREAVGLAVIGIEAVVIIALLIGGIVGIACGAGTQQLHSLVIARLSETPVEIIPRQTVMRLGFFPTQLNPVVTADIIEVEIGSSLAVARRGAGLVGVVRLTAFAQSRHPIAMPSFNVSIDKGIRPLRNKTIYRIITIDVESV